MAFTEHELWTGGRRTWSSFMALLLLGTALHFAVLDASSIGSGTPLFVSGLAVLVPVGIVGGCVSAVVMLFGVALVRPIARALRRVRSRATHLAVYALLGVAVGTAYLASVRGGRILDVIHVWDLFAVAPALAAAVAVPWGWWQTARRALREDAGLEPRQRYHPVARATDETRNR